MKKEIETINKGQEEMKNTISELKNTVEGIKTRLHEQRIGQQNGGQGRKTPKMSKKSRRGSER